MQIPAPLSGRDGEDSLYRGADASAAQARHNRPMNSTRRSLLTTGAAGVAGASLALWLQRRTENPPPRPVATVPGIRSKQPGAARPPNILLVMTDQERMDLPDGLPLPGHDRLRERGTTFTAFHVNTTPCSPSRSNFYFGRHTQHTGMMVNLGVYPEPQIPAHLPSLGHFLRANGYDTAYKGKWHLSELRAHYELTYGRYPNSRNALEPFGFSDFNFDGDPHGATWTGYKYDAQIAADSAQWLLQRGKASERPWMLAVNLVNPHDVMYFATGAVQAAGRRLPDYLAPLAGAPPDAHYRRHWDALALPANRDDPLSTKPWAHRNYNRFCDMAFGPVPASEAAWRAYQDYYFNCIRDADRHLLTVLDALEASGEAGRTVVVFTSDHGEMAGAHGLRQKGPFMYQENTRVPLIVRHPDARHGAQTTALGSAVDLIPTLLALTGLDPARITEAYPQLAGVSLAQQVATPNSSSPRDARGHLFNYNTTHYIDSDYAEELARSQVTADRWMPLRALAAGLPPLPRRDNPALFRGIHTGTHKFARYFRPAEHHEPVDWTRLTAHNELELYDLRDDPLELRNLAHRPDTVDASTQALILALNARLNGLIRQEVGADLGDELPGPGFLKRL